MDTKLNNQIPRSSNTVLPGGRVMVLANGKRLHAFSAGDMNTTTSLCEVLDLTSDTDIPSSHQEILSGSESRQREVEEGWMLNLARSQETDRSPRPKVITEPLASLSTADSPSTDLPLSNTKRRFTDLDAMGGSGERSGTSSPFKHIKTTSTPTHVENETNTPSQFTAAEPNTKPPRRFLLPKSTLCPQQTAQSPITPPAKRPSRINLRNETIKKSCSKPRASPRSGLLSNGSPVDTTSPASSATWIPSPSQPGVQLFNPCLTAPQRPPPTPTPAQEQLFTAEINQIKNLLQTQTDKYISICTALHNKNVELENKIHELEAAQKHTSHERCRQGLEAFVKAFSDRIDQSEQLCQERLQEVLLQVFEETETKRSRVIGPVPGGDYGGPKNEAPRPGPFAGLTGTRR
jgi:hypothetical protein